MDRLRVAGFTDASALYVFLWHGGMLLPAVGAPKLVFVRPTNEDQPDPGYPNWMGGGFAPGPTGNLAQPEDLG